MKIIPGYVFLLFATIGMDSSAQSHTFFETNGESPMFRPELQAESREVCPDLEAAEENPVAMAARATPLSSRMGIGPGLCALSCAALLLMARSYLSEEDGDLE